MPVRMLPTWATMGAFDRPLSLPFDAAFVRNDAVLSWVALENSKPGRPGVNDRPAAAIGGGPGEGADGGRAGVRERWVLHASHAWNVWHAWRAKRGCKTKTSLQPRCVRLRANIWRDAELYDMAWST